MKLLEVVEHILYGPNERHDMMLINKKSNNFSRLKILWVSFLILDMHLHKTTQLEILKNLEKQGHKTFLIAVRSKHLIRNENQKTKIIAIPLRYIPIISPIIFTAMLFAILPITILKFNPDFIIVEPDIPIISLMPNLFIRKLINVKFILDIRSTPVETRGFRGLVRRFWFFTSIKIAKKLINKITIITPLMQKEICYRFNIDPEMLGVWTSGVSPNLFYPEKYASEILELKRKFRLIGKFVIFYHGIFTHNRGLIESVESIKIIKEGYPNVCLFLLGNGPILSTLKHLIYKNNIQDNVLIHDTVDYSEVPKFIGMADICISPLPNHPYWRFQCPLKVLEYLSMKKVVIASDIPAHRMIIGNKKCAIFISSIRKDEISKAIEYAILNKEKLNEWGKIGREIVSKKYTWEKVAKDLEKFLLKVRR